MRILVHDYSGHPFQLELSRWLARQGHDVLHLYSSAISTPRGAVERGEADAPSLTIESVGKAEPIEKYEIARRLRQERAYGLALARRTAVFQPKVVLSGNCSPQIQRILQARCRRDGTRFVYWLQDLYADAAQRFLARRSALLARLFAPALRAFEARALRRSDAVVAITEDFRAVLVARGVAPEKITVIENWAPLAEVTPRDRCNAWSAAHGLDNHFVLLYAGTLGLKHNPDLLAGLARAFAGDPAARVVVVSQGMGREFLEMAKRAEGLDNLLLLDWQPYEQLPEVLASSDVLLAILEPEAGRFAVPSKVLTSLCTARPILAAIPPENLAARTIGAAGAGLCVAPDDGEGFVAAARRLREGEAQRRAMAESGRAYAECAFDIERTGPRFLSVLLRDGETGENRPA